MPTAILAVDSRTEVPPLLAIVAAGLAPPITFLGVVAGFGLARHSTAVVVVVCGVSFLKH